jgi:Divergent InlB B-repeat domain
LLLYGPIECVDYITNIGVLEFNCYWNVYLLRYGQFRCNGWGSKSLKVLGIDIVPSVVRALHRRCVSGTQTRTATLTVNPPSLLVTPTTSIVASGTHGGPFSPSSFQYELSATYGSVNYSITPPTWLTASSTSGTVTTKVKTVTFRINSSADKLSPTTYVNSISFNNTTNNQGNTSRLATLNVNPKQFKITVDASPKADGTVSGGGTFAEGTPHTVTAAPNSAHTFIHWTESGRVVSTSESYTFTLNGNVTLVADFR